MAGNARLVAPRIVVVREGEEPLEVQTDNRDLLGWEATRVRHKWPNMQDAPFKWMTFLGWSAARRAGELDNAVTYEQWESTVLSVTAAEDPDPGDAGLPTEPGPVPG